MAAVLVLRLLTLTTIESTVQIETGICQVKSLKSVFERAKLVNIFVLNIFSPPEASSSLLIDLTVFFI